MAYNQQPRYAASTMPQYGDPDPSHNVPYANRHGGEKMIQRTVFGMEGRQRHPQHPNTYEPHDDYPGYRQNPWSEQEDGACGYQDNYGNAGWCWQEAEPFAQHPQHGSPKPQWDVDDEPRRGEILSERSQRLATPPYSSRKEHNGSSGHDKSHGERAPCDTVQGYQGASPRNHNDGSMDGKSYRDRQPVPFAHNHSRQPQYVYGHPSADGYHHQAQPNGRGQEAFHDPRPATNSRSHHDARIHPKSPKPANGEPAADKSSHNGNPIPSRSKRINGEVKSPETLAWDNPFPTFPTKPKKSSRKEPSSVQSSTSQIRINTTSQHKANENRPQTVRSEDSHSSSLYSKDSVFESYSDHRTGFTAPDKATSINSQYNDYAEQPLPPPKNPISNSNVAHEQSRTRKEGQHGMRLDQSMTPATAQSRHSEDNRIEPPITNENSPSSGYERSRTMPAAVSETIVDSGLIPAEDNCLWQEPGSVAGYFGPEDKGFLPIGQASGSQQRPQAPSRSHSDESRWGNKDHAKSTPKIVALPSHTVAESVGEIFESSQGEPPKQYPPYQQTNAHNGLTAVDDEMPNFDAVTDTGGRRRGMTIEDHLQPQVGKHKRTPPTPAHSGPYEQRNFPISKYASSQIPRSKSQPDLGGGRQPKPQQNQGFDFGIPAPAERRPATSAASSDFYYTGEFAMVQPSDPWRAQDPRIRPHNGPRPRTGQDSGPHKQHRGPEPRRLGHEPPQQSRAHPKPLPNPRSAIDRTRPPESRPYPTNVKSHLPPPSKSIPNPDALPHHPAPIRPGLANGPVSNQISRPAPVRQYNAVPDPVQQPRRSSFTEGNDGSRPVTHQMLESLRQKTLRSPSDQAAQLLLAKKLVEAATVLVDERTDPNTKKRNRDKYNSDALKTIKKLSANGYPDADFFYADCYSRGALGLQSDIKEAFTLYQKAAKANHAQAAYRVAVCCEIGQEEGGGTKRDAIKAMQWYKRAATLGDVAAMYKMGVIQLKGLLNQPKNPTDAVTWLKRAAERADKENPHALHELALLYEKPISIDSIKHDEAQSRQLFIRAANLGYKFSQFRLGCAYEYGLLGCPVDPRQSIAWYSKAAVQGEHQSELALSGWYLTGSEGVLQQSDTEAYLWARKAAQAGLAKAEYAMGYFTEVGIGAPANLEDAKRWYWRSASQNFPKARDRLEDLRKGGATKQKARVSRSNMRKQSDGECIIM